MSVCVCKRRKKLNEISSTSDLLLQYSLFNSNFNAKKIPALENMPL